MNPPDPVEKKPKERGIQTNEKNWYQIMLNNAGEEIMVYLLSSNDDLVEDDNENEEEDWEDGEGEDDKSVNIMNI